MNKFATQLAATTIVMAALAAASAAQAGLPHNGPELTGTRMHISGISSSGDEAALIPGNDDGTCMPSTGCPTNGPELTGSSLPMPIGGRSDEVSLIPGSDAGTCVPGSGCPSNGPEMTGVRLPVSGFSIQDVRASYMREATSQ